MFCFLPLFLPLATFRRGRESGIISLSHFSLSLILSVFTASPPFISFNLCNLCSSLFYLLFSSCIPPFLITLPFPVFPFSLSFSPSLSTHLHLFPPLHPSVSLLALSIAFPISFCLYLFILLPALDPSFNYLCHPLAPSIPPSLSLPQSCCRGRTMLTVG